MTGYIQIITFRRGIHNTGEEQTAVCIKHTSPHSSRAYRASGWHLEAVVGISNAEFWHGGGRYCILGLLGKDNGVSCLIKGRTKQPIRGKGRVQTVLEQQKLRLSLNFLLLCLPLQVVFQMTGNNGCHLPSGVCRPSLSPFFKSHLETLGVFDREAIIYQALDGGYS